MVGYNYRERHLSKQNIRINGVQIKNYFAVAKIINIPRGILLGVGGSGMGIAAMKGRRIRNTMIYFVKAILQFGNNA